MKPRTHQTISLALACSIILGEEGEYSVFRGNSPHGLSTFAVFMVETIQSTGPAEFKMGLAKRF
ncbi:hypothetical protein HY772_05325 [Candidatus Woesearchaeota archaeon]|nr:hypothetical protein [Candidatus Woesearchaeota archaeon]